MASAYDEFLKNALDETARHANYVMRAVGVEALKRIIERTPVDTGRARANWNAAIGQVEESFDESLSASDVATALQDGTGVVQGVDFAKGEILYLCNGLPYIMRLEDGSSSQAPSGMVGVTIEEMRAYADQVAGEAFSGRVGLSRGGD